MVRVAEFQTPVRGIGAKVNLEHHMRTQVEKLPALMTFPENAPVERRQVRELSAELLSLREMLSALAGPKVQLQLNVDGCPTGAVSIAPIDMTKVLINLVRNASEAVAADGVISISAIKFGGQGGIRRSVMISVEDDGPAIPLALLDSIFKTEASLESAGAAELPRTRVKSRGLGLRIVRQLVEAAGGSVRAMRLPERGSRIEILLPMVEADAESSVA